MAIAYVNYTFQASCDTTYNLNWATVRAQSSSEAITNNQCNVESSAVSDPRFMIKRGFITFNTNGALPTGYTVSSVVLRIAWGAGFGNQGYYVVPNAMANPTSISTADYNKLTGTAYSAKFSGSGTLDVTLTGLTVNNSGYTKLGIITYSDYENSAPALGTNGIAGTRTPATLVITYTTPPVVTTNNYAQNINVNSATLLGEVTDVGGGTVSERGICWSMSENPTISNSKASSAGGLGQFQVNATGLYPAVKYHYRAYVTTENSTTYGADKTFTTFGGASGIFMM